MLGSYELGLVMAVEIFKYVGRWVIGRGVCPGYWVLVYFRIHIMIYIWEYVFVRDIRRRIVYGRY